MPKRKRHQEWKRRLRHEITKVEVEVQREEAEQAFLSLDPLNDAYWPESMSYWCCAECDGPNHPLNILADAEAEIAAFKRGSKE